MIEISQNRITERNNSMGRLISKLNTAEEKKISELEDSPTEITEMETQRESTLKKETRQSIYRV